MTTDSLAKAHEGLAARAAIVREKQSQRRLAKQNYERALDLLRQLKARNALSHYDRKSLDEMQAILQKHEQER